MNAFDSEGKANGGKKYSKHQRTRNSTAANTVRGDKEGHNIMMKMACCTYVVALLACLQADLTQNAAQLASRLILKSWLPAGTRLMATGWSRFFTVPLPLNPSPT